jgi:hypothetical protein
VTAPFYHFLNSVKMSRAQKNNEVITPSVPPPFDPKTLVGHGLKNVQDIINNYLQKGISDTGEAENILWRLLLITERTEQDFKDIE